MTVGEWWARWLEVFPRGDVTAANNRRMTRAFMLEFEQKELAWLGNQDFNPRVRRWAVDHPSHARYVKAMLNDAVRAKLIESHPLEDWSDPWKPRKPKGIPSAAGVASLARAAEEVGGKSFGDAVTFAAYTGIRCKELCDARVDDLEEILEGHLTVPLGKGGKHRVVAILGPAAALTFPQEGHLFCGPSGLPLSTSNVRRLWGRARLSLGMVYAGYNWHVLRHFHLTWLLEQGASAEDVAMQGWGTFDTRELVRTYGHPDAMPALDRLREVTS